MDYYYYFFFSICRNSWSSIYSVVPTIIEIICHHITIWLIKIKSGENKMIRAILAIFAWEKCFLCSAAFFLSILNFCHWHLYWYHIDYLHCKLEFFCRMELDSAELLPFPICKWFLISDACMAILMWFLDCIFFLKKKWWHNRS